MRTRLGGGGGGGVGGGGGEACSVKSRRDISVFTAEEYLR